MIALNGALARTNFSEIRTLNLTLSYDRLVDYESKFMTVVDESSLMIRL